jgi:hypothetical protein
MAREKGTGQPKGIVETTLAGVNPRDTDYGVTVEDWRKELFEHTIGQFYFWSLMLLFLALGCSVMANGWFLRERERRLTISSDIVAQLYNAYVGSRAKALEVISKYNSLVERYNRLDAELREAKSDLTDEVSGQTIAPSEFDEAKRDKPDELNPPLAGQATSVRTAEEARDADTGMPTRLEELEAKLKRKEAQLQAKDNQITNLRGRLTRAHDSLQGERQQKSGTK